MGYYLEWSNYRPPTSFYEVRAESVTMWCKWISVRQYAWNAFWKNSSSPWEKLSAVASLDVKRDSIVAWRQKKMIHRKTDSHAHVLSPYIFQCPVYTNASTIENAYVIRHFCLSFRGLERTKMLTTGNCNNAFSSGELKLIVLVWTSAKGNFRKHWYRFRAFWSKVGIWLDSRSHESSPNNFKCFHHCKRLLNASYHD